PRYLDGARGSAIAGVWCGDGAGEGEEVIRVGRDVPAGARIRGRDDVTAVLEDQERRVDRDVAAGRGADRGRDRPRVEVHEVARGERNRAGVAGNGDVCGRENPALGDQ